MSGDHTPRYIIAVELGRIHDDEPWIYDADRIIERLEAAGYEIRHTTTRSED